MYKEQLSQMDPTAVMRIMEDAINRVKTHAEDNPYIAKQLGIAMDCFEALKEAQK